MTTPEGVMDEETVLRILRDPRFSTVEQQRTAMARGADLVERYRSQYDDLQQALVNSMNSRSRDD